MASPPSFRVASKTIFLTYPRCTLTKPETLSLLQNLFPNRPPSYIRVSSETHEDGFPHLHCLLQFPYKLEIQNQRFFDLVSPTRATHFHPNVQGARNATSVRDYISKYGDYEEWGQFQPGGRSSNDDRLKQVYSAALATNNVIESLQIIKEGDPKAYRRHYKRLWSNSFLIFSVPESPYNCPFGGNFSHVPDSVTQWALANVFADPPPHRPLSLIIEGPSRTGKTCWARSLGRHNHYCGHIDLKHHDDGAIYNIIDNVQPKFLKQKHWKEFIGAKRDWISDCKYAKPRKIKGGIPSIVLCNPGPLYSYAEYLNKSKNHALKSWTEENAQFEFINAAFFTTEPEATTQNSEEPTTAL